MKKIISFLMISIILIALFVSMSDSDFGEEKERWTEVSYTKEIFADYGDYFPLEISFRSLGKLPTELIEISNYTNTVFISRYSISSNTSAFNKVDKLNSQSNWIGKDWKTITFDDIESKDLVNVTAIDILLTLYPHNMSLGLGEDVYSFTISIAEEVDLVNVLPVTSLIFIPLLIIPSIIWWHKFLNGQFLTNVTFKNLLKYSAKFPLRFIKSKRKIKIKKKRTKRRSRFNFSFFKKSDTNGKK